MELDVHPTRSTKLITFKVNFKLGNIILDMGGMILIWLHTPPKIHLCNIQNNDLVAKADLLKGTTIIHILSNILQALMLSWHLNKSCEISTRLHSPYFKKKWTFDNNTSFPENFSLISTSTISKAVIRIFKCSQRTILCWSC